MTESQLTVKLCLLLERYRVEVIPIVGSTMQKPGYPDRYIGHPLWHGFVEFKAYDGKLDAKQRIRINDLNRATPGIAFVVRFVNTYNCELGNIEDTEGNHLSSFRSAYEMLIELSAVTQRKIHETYEELVAQKKRPPLED